MHFLVSRYCGSQYSGTSASLFFWIEMAASATIANTAPAPQRRPALRQRRRRKMRPPPRSIASRRATVSSSASARIRLCFSGLIFGKFLCQQRTQFCPGPFQPAGNSLGRGACFVGNFFVAQAVEAEPLDQFAGPIRPVASNAASSLSSRMRSGCQLRAFRHFRHAERAATRDGAGSQIFPRCCRATAASQFHKCSAPSTLRSLAAAVRNVDWTISCAAVSSPCPSASARRNRRF